MPVFINGGPIAICDRCSVKMLLKELSPDRDSPGLMVCADCNDVRDPWRLPFVPKDGNVSVPGARPDEAFTPTDTTTVNSDGTVVTAPVPSEEDLAVYPRSD